MRTKTGVVLIIAVALIGAGGTAAACEDGRLSGPDEAQPLSVYKPIYRVDGELHPASRSLPVVMAGPGVASESGCLPEVADRIASHPQLQTFHRLIERAGMVEALAMPAGLTVLAPTDQALAEMPADRLRELEADRSVLVAFLRRHVVMGLLDTPLLEAHSAVLTASYEPLFVRAEHGLTVGGAKVIGPSLGARNAVIHLIDRPLSLSSSI